MSSFKMCTRCVMDTTDPNILFDKDGACNHCKKATEMLKKGPYALGIAEKKE